MKFEKVNEDQMIFTIDVSGGETWETGLGDTKFDDHLGEEQKNFWAEMCHNEDGYVEKIVFNRMPELDAALEQLEEFIELDNSEQQEVCDALITALQYPDYVSDEFREALEKEIVSQLINYKTHCEIITEDVVVPEKTVKQTRLGYR